jgi:hypothetical protein
MGGYEEDGRRYVSLAGLRARGWTGGMVHRLLGAPDRLALNPRFRAAPPARLYRVERVEAAERSEEFRVVAEAAARRSDAVRAALRRRQEEVLERIRAEPIEVPRLDSDKLASRAVEHRKRSETDPPGGGGNPEPGAVGGPEAAGAPGRAGRASLDHWKVDYLVQRLLHQAALGRAEGAGRAAAHERLHEIRVRWRHWDRMIEKLTCRPWEPP